MGKGRERMGGRNEKGREMMEDGREGKGGAEGAFRQIKIYDYTPGYRIFAAVSSWPLDLALLQISFHGNT